MNKKVKITAYFFGFFSFFLVANFVLAADFGVAAVNNGLAGSLSSTDPRIIVGRIIQIVLSFLGAIAVAIIMYAGFLWMASGGDEEKISKAKKILRNATIGLVIIVSSWGIATFVISKLIEATGGNATGLNNGNNSFFNQGAGAIGACSISSTYPESDQTDVPRNTSVMVTFKEELKLDSVCINESGAACACNNSTCSKINPTAIRLFKTDSGDACTSGTCPKQNSNVTDILVNVASGNKTLVLTPMSALGESSGNTEYSIKLTSDVKKVDGTSMFKSCSVDFAGWNFTVNSQYDLTPPIVKPTGIFPLPDNERDVYLDVTPAKAASGIITVQACPHVYSAASIKSINPSGPTATLDYHGSANQFKIAVPADAPNKAQLYDGGDNLLGVADFNSSGVVIFKDYLNFTASNHPAGSLWTIDINPEQLADTLTVGDTDYVFAVNNENNNIKVPAKCINEAMAANIQAKLSGDPVVNVDRQDAKVSLTAKIAGVSGNSIALITTNANALSIQPLSGGTDRQINQKLNDKPDRPMNSAIQINFSKPLNPITVSGSAQEVDKYIRIVNADASSSPAGAACANNNKCKSYKCENSKCVGDYLSGKYAVSNGYKTVEFISDVECGVNGCGEKIYCLPANSHLAVELMAADLKTCQSDADCLAYSPFKNCATTALGYSTCQNPEGNNYPLANLANLDGIVDASMNSFDGARNGFSDGPFSFYNDNYSSSSPINQNKKDKYKWSFFVNDQINLTPPQITLTKPSQGGSGIGLADPLEIDFNALMLNSTLQTGSISVNNGSSTNEHKLINLRSSAASPVGYWVMSDNIDTAPLDGEPDLTVAKIFHSPFAESVTFKAQVGSGVKDIYQNCYKPSVGPYCTATEENPSCCFGIPTATLGADGNCR